MASEIFNVSSIESFLPVYEISTTDFSEMSYENILTDLNKEQILDSIFDECISTSNDNMILVQNSDDDVQEFLKEFLLIRPKDTESRLDEDLSRNADYQLVTIDESNESPQLIVTSESSTLPEDVTSSLIVIPAQSSTDLNMTPLTSRQQRYRSQPPQVCDLCGKIFRARQHLRRHRLEKHTDLSPDKFAYPCQQCDKRFKRREHLQLHQRIKHLNLKDYTCETCGKGFVTKHHLARHMLHHERKKNAAICTGCGRVFARRGNLVKHEANGCVGIRGPGAR